VDWSLLFSFKGRINRAKYWLMTLLYTVLFFAVSAAIWMSFNAVLATLGAVTIAAMVWSGCAVATKRLHDRDKSGWWLLFFYVVPGILTATHNALVRTGEETAILLAAACALISGVISFWMLIELGFLRGTAGPNHYGPDPLA
jgi:uncharacterized membrane protein YhaH (DUF805 family)